VGIDWASRTVMPFGKYKGKTLDSIGRDVEGLKYLDWLLGEIGRDPSKKELSGAIGFFLKDPANSDRLDAALGD
jgi:hypothetical protein